MSQFKFYYYMDCEDGKMARVETTEDLEIPVNIFIDNADESKAVKGDLCSIDVCGIGSNIEIFASEETYESVDSKLKMAIPSMIPIGTFPADPDDKMFEESPHILFTGRVVDVEWDSEAESDEPNCCILVETLEFTFNLFLRYDAPIEKGYIVHGIAWLFGDMKMIASETE